MASSDAKPVPQKNAACRIYFDVRKSDGTLITSWTGADSEVSLDGASYGDCTNEATEIGTSGTGFIDLTAAELNTDSTVYKLTLTNTGALPVVIPLYPAEAGDIIIDAHLRSASFATDTDVYDGRCWIFDDDGGTTDRYVVTWIKNGGPVVSGITSPTIQVIKASDGSDLVASTAMTQIAATGLYRKDCVTTERIASGAAYMAKVQATIDSATRTFYQPIGRDST